jgi:hypothetical protein
MATYRLYLLGDCRRLIEAYKEFEAPSDAAALGLARHFSGPQRMDLWIGARKVAHFDPPAARPVAPGRDAPGSVASGPVASEPLVLAAPAAGQTSQFGTDG